MGLLRGRQIHLDFHTSEQITGIAKDFDGEEFARTLLAAGVNSITCFSKCHHGMIYHDTKFEARHPYLERNLLKEQIEACHRYGIRIPIYISVGFDEFMAAKHPEWICVDCEGKHIGAGPLQAGWHNLCLNSPYVDYICAQTEEVLDMFGDEVDGLFFDIVSQEECCCRNCMKSMMSAGLNPESSEDRNKFAARVVVSFKERIADVIRAKNPKCGIFSNAGHIGPAIKSSLSSYSHLELESLPSGGWGYEHFPVSARYARNLGLEFLGQTGKFHKSWADFGGFKTQAALEYECFTALALGGGCEVGDQLHPSGRLTKATYKLIGDVYKQVEQKEPWCRDARPRTEIGVVTPELVNPGVPRQMCPIAAGVFRMLNELHYQYDFIDLEMDLPKYKVVILPDILRLNAQQASVLNDYVHGGGKLVVSYESGMSGNGHEFLIDNMPAKVKGDAPFSPDFLVAEAPIADGIPESEHVMYERGFEIEPSASAKSLASVWKPYFNRDFKHYCSHFHTPVEGPAGYPGIVMNDNIVYAAYPIFGMYKRHGARVYRDMLMNALKLLLPDEKKLVVTNAPTTADITLNYQPAEDRYVLHILHYIPERRYSHADTIEDILPIYRVAVDLNLPKGYDIARIVPDGETIITTRLGDKLSFVVPKIEGHCMLEISKTY